MVILSCACAVLVRLLSSVGSFAIPFLLTTICITVIPIMRIDMLHLCGAIMVRRIRIVIITAPDVVYLCVAVVVVAVAAAAAALTMCCC
eukprot:1051599-Alexandrium_andersonii.AAC.1